MGLKLQWPVKNDKQSVKKQGSKGIEASSPDARIFLEGLIDGYSNNFSVKDSKDALKAYNSIPQLNTVIDLIANSMNRANKILYTTDKTGKKIEVTSGTEYDLLKTPHFLQSSSEFWKTVIINWKLCGAQQTYKKESVGYGVTSALALPTSNVMIKAKENYNILKVTDIKDVIDYYELTQDNKTIKITDPNDIWNLQDQSLTLDNDGYLVPVNPLASLEKTLGTLVIISDIKNELLGNHGAMGIINPDGKDADGESVPLLPDEKTELQQAYEDYGIKKGKYKLLITNNSVKFTSISLKIAELLLNEFEERAERILSSKFQIPITYFSPDNKYQNKEMGDKELFENNIIPASKILTGSFNSSFGFTEKNLELVFDYSHISFLQKDKKETATANNLDSQNIIKLNTAVADKKMTRDAAIDTLVRQGVNKDEALKLINEPIIIESNNE